MKLKVGILTTYFASNFGAMLQPFALKRHLEMLGCEVEMIRYKQENIYKYYNPWKPEIFKLLNPLRIAAYLYRFPELIKRDKIFKNFMWKHINPVKGFCDFIPQDKDFYFIGSDQIWSPKNTNGFDDIYFGKFDANAGSIKASYAASAENIEYSVEQISYLKKNITNFDYVSVREKVLENNIRKATGREDIVTVLDPTMLVDPIVYNEIDVINPSPNHKFVFFYGLRSCFDFTEKIYQYAQGIGATLIIAGEMIDKRYSNFAKSKKDVTYLSHAGIETFLGCIKYAEFVFTSSFHGSIFAILNHKRFHTLHLHDNCMTRPINLLEMLGISDRLLSINDKILEMEIDYVKVENLLDIQRNYSRQFVLKVLNRK